MTSALNNQKIDLKKQFDKLEESDFNIEIKSIFKELIRDFNNQNNKVNFYYNEGDKHTITFFLNDKEFKFKEECISFNNQEKNFSFRIDHENETIFSTCSDNLKNIELNSLKNKLIVLTLN